MLRFLMLSFAVHGVTKNILDYKIIFSFNPVHNVIPN